MVNDKKIIISVGSSRWAKNWPAQEIYWSDFVQRVSKPTITGETFADYKRLPKAKQDGIKDIGGYVGGRLRDNQRKAPNVIDRQLVALDADSIPPGETQRVIDSVGAMGCAYCIYSTRKYEGAKPRLRILIPLDRPVTPDEYQAIARKLAATIDMQIFDPTTFEPSRLMYWPSTSSDGEYVFTYADLPWANADGVLAMYTDWHDARSWPQVDSETRPPVAQMRKQGDPTGKSGVVGAFCRAYTIDAAIETFLNGIYTPCDDGRYTYAAGSTVGGAVTYDDGKFLYSHHATDPCSCRLVNAFDLVRLHLFGAQDDAAKADTPTVQLPSYRAMLEFAVADETTAHLLNAERYARATEEFSGAASETPDVQWMDSLEMSSATGKPQKTIDNVLIILNHDPMLRGKIAHDEFANRPIKLGALPWDKDCPDDTEKIWTDVDDAGLRHYIEKTHGITGKERIMDAFALCARANGRHKIKDYLRGLVWDNTPRLDTLLIDYFGAEDTLYHRLAIRKALTAAVARIMRPGTKFDHTLILSGAQGIGKSTFFRKLGKDWYTDCLSRFDGKEGAEQIQGYWIVEIGELTGFSRAEINDIKQFLSRQDDIYREPYGRHTAVFPRQCVFFGTTNEHEYLRDHTGNRRFWPVDTGAHKPTKNVFTDLDAEIDQIWAEAVMRYTIGETLYLEGAAEAEALRQQEGHKEVSVKEGMIKSYVDRLLPDDWAGRDLNARRMFLHGEFGTDEGCVKREKVCALEVWCELFNGDPKLMRRADSMEINAILSNLPGWKRTKSNVFFGKLYGHQKGFESV